ncbi:hypothetical protein XA68_17135 [Ophiocordyceps unilateralis]|uniref:Uncharacterized protein n=1 Tax=Ophiocordyceps unilateralis TaxID=268505 RepID=A0A2A9P5D9_OPHUN|nr:hypothetical protein XA68_17135 [Ophiocordyceps unilateralis]
MDHSSNLVSSILDSPSYSPTVLTHLPPPTPRDMMPGQDPSVFTFADAFEDLLAVSQAGQPLPDIAVRYAQSRLLRRMFPAGEPDWFYARRLQAQRLMPPAPRSEPGPDWNAFHRLLDSQAREVWRSSASSDRQPNQRYEDDNSLSSDAHPLHRDANSHNVSASNADDRQLRPSLATVFDELLSSAVAEGQKSWDTLLNMVAGRKPAATGLEEKNRAAMTDGSGTLTEYFNMLSGNEPPVDEDLRMTAPTQTRHEDVDGCRKTTVVQPIIDGTGRQVGQQTTIFISRRDAKDEDESGHDETVRQDKKSGWFWK